MWVSAGIVPGLGDLGRGSVRGRAAIATFLRGWPLSGARRARLVATHADGRPALATSMWRAERRAFVAHDIVVLTMDGGRIAEITAFLTDGIFETFGLPRELASTNA